MEPKTLGARLKSARTNRNLTQDQLARRVGISRSLISQWESGLVAEIGAGNLHKTAKTLGVSLDWLLDGQEAIPSEEALLLEDWELLTASQQERIRQEIAKLADLNRELLEELAQKGR